MPLFRFHRATLEESLKTTTIVKNEEELLTILNSTWKEMFPTLEVTSLKISNYGFDKRIGWYTQIVSANKNNIVGVEGFLSEPFN